MTNTIHRRDGVEFTEATVQNWFVYHAPTPEQVTKYAEIREAARAVAMALINDPQSVQARAYAYIDTVTRLCPNAGTVLMTQGGEVRMGFACEPGHTCLTAYVGLPASSTMTAPARRRGSGGFPLRATTSPVQRRP